MAKISSLTIEAFRGFGASPQTIEFTAGLTVIWAPNSQGKTSVAEALEFLLAGRISRKQLIGSAAREFAGSLRNVHLDRECAVRVSAVIIDDEDTAHEVVRELVQDYGPRNDCESRLTIDGIESNSLAELGIRLAEPPLETPILLQHTLRFVLSARPQDRSNYFKAVLEITDLERLRDTVTGVLSGLERPPSPHLSRLLTALDEEGLQEARTRLNDVEDPEEAVRESLKAALESILGTGPVTLTELVQAAQRKVRETREEVFPLSALEISGGIPTTPDAAPFAEAARKFVHYRNSAVESDLAVQKLYKAYHDLQHTSAELGDEGEPEDCPLCLTPKGLSANRIRDILQSLESTEAFRTARQEVVSLSEALARDLDFSTVALETCVPEVVRTPESTPARSIQVSNLSLMIEDEESTEVVTAWSGALEALTSTWNQTLSAASAMRNLVPDDVERLEETSLTGLESAQQRLEDSLSALRERREEFRRRSELFVAAVTPVLDSRQGLGALKELAALHAEVKAIAAELEEVEDFDRVVRLVEEAIVDIDRAKAAVLDEKFSALAGDISRWWAMLRSEEPTFFAGVQRVGSGRRFMDLKAGLSAGGSGSENIEERDAVAVFSDSQLNCLGLSAFLARVSRSPSGFVVLDDPIQGSDSEHRASFIESIPSAIMDEGQQVVVFTHDERLRRDLVERYSHLELREYAVLLEDPGEGAVVEQTRDSVDEMLLRVAPHKKKQDVPSRKRNASLLRDAAERLCKILLVREDRRQGRVAHIGDYDDNLGTLVGLVEPLLTKDPAHPGKLRVIKNQLNPGNHDDGAPPATEIAMILGDLKKLTADYLSVPVTDA